MVGAGRGRHQIPSNPYLLSARYCFASVTLLFFAFPLALSLCTLSDSDSLPSRLRVRYECVFNEHRTIARAGINTHSLKNTVKKEGGGGLSGFAFALVPSFTLFYLLLLFIICSRTSREWMKGERGGGKKHEQHVGCRARDYGNFPRQIDRHWSSLSVGRVGFHLRLRALFHTLQTFHTRRHSSSCTSW